MFLVSSCSSWSQVLIREWWCSWSSVSAMFQLYLSDKPFCYTPVFRWDVLWYGSVRPSICPSVRLLARKNIDPIGGFFPNLACRCACLSPHSLIKQRKCQHTIIETVLLARNYKIKQSNETLSQFCTLHNHGPTHMQSFSLRCLSHIA